MGTYTSLDFDEYATNNVEPMFKALYYLQRTPGCDEEAAALSLKLSEEFKKFPEKADSKGRSCIIVGGFKYYDSGRTILTSADYYHVMLPSWEPASQTGAEAQKPAKKKNPSYAYMKKINPIWYAQLMRYKKRNFSVTSDEKIRYEELLEKKRIYDEELSDEEKEMIRDDKIIWRLEDHASAIHKLFELNHWAMNLYYNSRRTWDEETRQYVYDDEVTVPTSFFFLTDTECEALCRAIEADGIGQRSYSHGSYTEHLSAVLKDILKKPSKDRKWIIRPSEESMMFQESKGTNSWGHTVTVDRVKHEFVYEHYMDEIGDIEDEDYLYILKRFGLQKRGEEEQDEGTSE